MKLFMILPRIFCRNLLHNNNYDYDRISGNEAKDASKVNLTIVARKPEETCNRGCLLCEPGTLWFNPSLLYHDSLHVSVLGSSTNTTNPSTQD